MSSRILVITGMHRSGTSLAASLFERAGLNLGGELLAPRRDNPLGFFEDAEFVRFHEDALHARGQNILVTREFAFAPTEDEKRRAAELVAARAAYRLWGWKDPRTCLFLDFWNEHLPDARYLFVYRHPFDVTLSLARRREVVGFDFYTGLDAWHRYNVRLLDFACRYPERTLICSSYALVREIESFRAVLERQFGMELPLNNALRDSVYQAEQLRRAPRTAAGEALLRQIHPEAMTLYDSLQAHATLRAQAALEPAAPELDALANLTAQLSLPWNEAQRRALLDLLVALGDPALFEGFVREHVRQTNELENQRRAWQETAVAREAALRAQTEWAQPRMRYLNALESNRWFRALVRLGILPRDTGRNV